MMRQGASRAYAPYASRTATGQESTTRPPSRWLCQTAPSWDAPTSLTSICSWIVLRASTPRRLWVRRTSSSTDSTCSRTARTLRYTWLPTAMRSLSTTPSGSSMPSWSITPTRSQRATMWPASTTATTSRKARCGTMAPSTTRPTTTCMW